MIYINNIYFGLLVFALCAWALTVPYLAFSYYKYGAIVWKRALTVYGFVLYAICAYFMVILPLPTVEAVENMTGPTMQLVPFSVVRDFLEHTTFRITDPSTYFSALKQGVFTQPVFNLILTIPFGIFMRRLFNLDFKKTVLASFICALFFELTQLSGLYGVYPRPYRLFDVDDLMLNTLGGVIGYWMSPLFNLFFVSKDAMVERAHEQSHHVSIMRRIVTFIIDRFIVDLILMLFVDNPSALLFGSAYLCYMFIMVCVMKDKTIGMRITNTQFISDKPQLRLHIMIRALLFIITIIWIPDLLQQLILMVNTQETIDVVMNVALNMINITFGLFLVAHVLWTGFIGEEIFFYEKLSHTRIVSSFTISNTTHQEV